MLSQEPCWYAACTRFNYEKKVAQDLAGQGINYYLPMMTTIRQWSDRKKKIEVPLIRSYIFVHVDAQDYRRTVETVGVRRILHFMGKPVVIPDWQIDNLKILLGAKVPAEYNIHLFSKGKEVRIISGPLTGLRGTILYIKGKHKLVISITALDYNLVIDIDPVFVEPV
jgi:transcriptional antiterminator RfaH